MKPSYFIFIYIFIVSCSAKSSHSTTEKSDQKNKSPSSDFDIQGHRGFRGLYPENSIEGFIAALDEGVTTLELDVVISKDSQIVVSHEPWMSSTLCMAPDGTSIREKDSIRYNIFNWNYEDIRSFDCGSLPHPTFPLQKKIKTHKPLLSEVVDTVIKWQKLNNKKIYFNIETKSNPRWDNIFTPPPSLFVKLLNNTIVELNIQHQTTIQSFDERTLQEFKKINPNLPLILLVNNKNGLDSNLVRLGFTPFAYSPNYLLVNKELITECHHRGIKIIPWTINNSNKMKNLIEMDVDGIITDFPDSLIKVLKQP